MLVTHKLYFSVQLFYVVFWTLAAICESTCGS